LGSWFERWIERKFSKEQEETAYVMALKNGCQCSAVFLLASGKEMEISVPCETLEALEPGRKGMLTWKGSTFISFEAEE